MAPFLTCSGWARKVDALSVLPYRDTVPTTTTESTISWPDRVSGPWKITLRWDTSTGRYECVGFEIASTIGSPVRTALLRSIPLAEIVAELRAELPPIKRATRKPSVNVEAMRPATVRRLTLVAETYLEAWGAGRSPTTAVAERLNVTDGAAGNLVHRARAAGLLPPTTPGAPRG